MTEMVYGQLPAREVDPLLPRWWRTIDKTSLSLVTLLFAIGMLLTMAASPPLAARNGFPAFHYVERQFIFGGMAFIVMIITSMLSPPMVRRLAVIGFVGAFVGLLLLPVLGTDFGKGAVRWYSLGFASLQPSEFLKPVYVVLCAWMIAASSEVGGPPGKRLSFLITIAVVALLVMQPDFGQACLMLFAWGVMYFVAGAPVVLLLGIGCSVVLSGIVAYSSSEHFARRIDGFLTPDIDPRTQLGLATNAIQEGGFFGVGVGDGQVKNILPDAHTDFIIAVAAEEYGFVLVLLIILLYLGLVLRTLFRLMQERDCFVRLAATGLICSFGVQAMINMGVAVRLLPAKGMTLPFISYGGSSLIAGGIALGMLLALTRTRPQNTLSPHLSKPGF